MIEQSNGLHFMYDHTGVMGFTYQGQTYFYQKDLQGNIFAIVNAAGVAVAFYHYDAWGNHKVYSADSLNEMTSPTFIGNLNPFRYRGYYYDSETKLYYLQSRYYDPEVGRFISADQVEYITPEAFDGLNVYSYNNNNPIMFIGNLFGFSRDNLLLEDQLIIGSKNKTYAVIKHHDTWSLFENTAFGNYVIDFSCTRTISEGKTGLFYSFINHGADQTSVGIGSNLMNKLGFEIYWSSDSFGVSTSFDFWLFGLEIGKNGVAISGGINLGNVSYEVSVKLGQFTLIACAVVAVIVSIATGNAPAAAAGTVLIKALAI